MAPGRSFPVPMSLQKQHGIAFDIIYIVLKNIIIMAEIKIEKKSPVWPWILVALAVIGIVIYLVAFNDDDDSSEGIMDTTELQDTTRQDAPNNATVNSYVSFVEEHRDQMGQDHEFTSEALTKLVNATEAMAAEINYDIRNDIDSVRMQADKVTQEPTATSHANSIREAADVLAGALQQIQKNAFPDLSNEADQVKNAASDIDGNELTLDQKDEVNNFFSESADLLEKMNNNAPEKQNYDR